MVEHIALPDCEQRLKYIEEAAYNTFLLRSKDVYIDTIPRRVYTQSHMDVVAESVERVYENRYRIPGLTMTFEPRYLRFFQARFEKIRAEANAQRSAQRREPVAN